MRNRIALVLLFVIAVLSLVYRIEPGSADITIRDVIWRTSAPTGATCAARKIYVVISTGVMYGRVSGVCTVINSGGGGSGDALTANPLSQFAPTTIAQLNSVISDADVQPLDSDLTAVAALAANGIVVRVTTGSISTRSIVGTANEITVSNGDAIGANPTLSLASGINAAKIGGGGVSTAEFDFIGTLGSNAQTQLDGKQPLDADLTTIAGLVDPNADRIVFWDDSAGAYAYLTAGSGLLISGTTITATGGGGGITNSAGNNVLMKSDGTNAIASLFTDDGTTATYTGTGGLRVNGAPSFASAKATLPGPVEIGTAGSVAGNDGLIGQGVALVISGNSGAGGPVFGIVSLFDAGGAGSPDAAYLSAGSRGSVSAPTALQSGDQVGGMAMAGYGTSQFNNVAFIKAYADENFTNTSAATHIEFRTTPTGSVTAVERVRITSEGALEMTILEVPNGTAPVSGQCDAAGEAGRIFVNTTATSGQQIYVCEGTDGWILQGDGGGGGGVPTTITVADTTDTTSFLAFFESATGDLAPKTDGAATYNASTGVLTATGFSGPLTGNVTGNVTGSSGSTTGNAATVTTNANLTGHVTSTGNAAVLGSFTIAQLNTAISDADAATLAGTETLSGKTLTAPVIADFTSAAHDHQDADDGGQLNATSVFSAGTVPTARLGSGTPGIHNALRGDQTWGGVGSLLAQTADPTSPAVGWIFIDTDDTNRVKVWDGDSWNVLYQGGVDLINLASNVTDTLPVANGGTGAATLTGLLQGNGTSAFTVITNSTTVGQTLRVTGSNAYGWGALDLADTDAVTGVLPAANHPTAAADGATLGLAAFTAADFNASSGAISVDYTNGQSASGSVKGFLASADWTTFNNKAPSADPVFTSSLQLPNGSAPTTDAFGEIAGDNNAQGASRGSVQFFDGTANTYLVGILASDTCTNGQVATWGTGGIWTCETAAGGGTTINSTDTALPYRLNSTTYADTSAFRVDANTLRMRNGASNQLFQVAVTDDNAGNDQRINLGIHGGTGLPGLFLTRAGTGGANHLLIGMEHSANIIMYNGGSQRWVFADDGHFRPIAEFYSIGITGTGIAQLFVDGTNIAAGTTGAATIDKNRFSVNFAAAATSLVVTNNRISTASNVICTVQTNDATLKSVAAVSASGSVTLHGDAAATAETRVACDVGNQ